ncbi:hypothetical protein D3C84_592040 [compost metagenome]
MCAGSDQNRPGSVIERRLQGWHLHAFFIYLDANCLHACKAQRVDRPEKTWLLDRNLVSGHQVGCCQSFERINCAVSELKLKRGRAVSPKPIGAPCSELRKDYLVAI